ncbi:MAG: TonB-dependent siderophore receptor [Parvibaculaceae bacterium]|nr:TonB-dependent siderophore receptor [Parvibaculaceae bacterium]
MTRQTGRELLLNNTAVAMLVVSTIFAAPAAARADDTQQTKADAPANPAAATLSPISVTATDTETRDDGVNGFVATRSTSATKTGASLLETPQTVTVITRNELDAQQAETVRAALRYAPGVHISDNPDNRLDSISARGFTLDQYLDGLKLLSGTWSVPKVEPYMLESVEILQGPSSVLYGQASPGGVLNFVSKKPTSEPIHEIQLQTGSYGRAQAAFDLGGPVDKEGHFLYRVTGLARTSGAQIDHTKEQRLNIAPSLTWQPDANTSLTILSSYLHDPKGGFWNLMPYDGTVLPNPFGKISRSFYTGDIDFEKFRRTQTMIGYQFEHRFNNIFTVRQNLRYNHMDIDYAAVQGLAMESDNRTLDRQSYTANERLNTVSVDNQLEAIFSTGALDHTLLTGLDYQHVRWDNFTRWSTTSSLDILEPDYHQNIPLPAVFQSAKETIRQLGLYGQDQIRWDHWSLLLAGREDWASSDVDNRIANASASQSDRAFTGRAGLTYLFDNGLAPYISYATSFQPTIGTNSTGDAFKPTKGQQEEIGIKFRPNGFNSLFTASLFNLTQKNVLTTDPQNVNFSVQTGKVRSRGVDLSAVTSLSNDLSIRTSYTYLRNKIVRDNSGLEGNTLGGVPRNSASIWADYTLHDGWADGLGLGGGARYVGSTYATEANTIRLSSYTLFDAAVRYDLGTAIPSLDGTQLAFNIYNLTDKEYIADGSFTGISYGMGRTFYATLSYKW